VQAEEKIQIRENKILRLSKVLIRDIPRNELINEEKIQVMIRNYIISKGTAVSGPSITFSGMAVGAKGQKQTITKLMFQLKHTITVESPYKFQETIRAENCLFARFTEKMENLQYAYHKLMVHAFERDMKLSGQTYSVFVNVSEHRAVVDIFMPLHRM